MTSATQLVISLIVLTGPACAATITAATGNADDVQAALDAAQDGDIVQVPAGTYAWSKAVKLGVTNWVGGKAVATGQKHLTLQGAGIDQTIIVNEVPRHPNSIDDALFVIHTAEGKPFRLTGMTLKGGTTETGYTGAVRIVGTDKHLRIDHVKFDRLQTRGLHISGDIYGVIDHCEFIINAWVQAIWIGHSAWGGQSYGDGSWASALTLGTEKAIYIEDNLFRAEGAATATATVDSWMGGRWVFRHNQVENMTIGNHGTESSGRWRGCFSMEIYDNTFHRSDPAHWWAVGMSRSGTCVMFNNVITGTYDSLFVLDNFREFHSFAFWGACDGTGVYDLNDGVVYDSGTHTGANGAAVLTATGKNWKPNQWVGYSVHNIRRGDSCRIVSNTADAITVFPDSYTRTAGPFTWNTGDEFKIMRAKVCLDGIGRATGLLLSGEGQPVPQKWPEQILEPVYEWGNTLNGADADIRSRAGLALEGRELYNDTPRPGYKPYPYPHPLQREWPPVPPTDRVAPTIPQGLAARAAGEGDVELTWTGATDNEAVAGYYVWLNGRRVTTVSDPNYTQYTFRQLPPPIAQYSFAVSAFDAAGNESAASASVSVR